MRKKNLTVRMPDGRRAIHSFRKRERAKLRAARERQAAFAERAARVWADSPRKSREDARRMRRAGIGAEEGAGTARDTVTATERDS